MPARAIALIVERIGANQSVTGEETRFRPPFKRGPVTVLSHEDMGGPASAAPAAQRPVCVGIAAGHCHIRLLDNWQSQQAGREGQFLVHELVPEERKLRPVLEPLSRNSGDVDEVIGAAGPDLTGAN